MIIGYGVAGQAALRALLDRDPGARVLVVDARSDGSPPHAFRQHSHSATSHPARSGNSVVAGGNTTTPGSDRIESNAGGVEFAPGERAIALDADRGLVTLLGARLREGEPNGAGKAAAREEVGFGRCLLALGSRPRPPPPGFIDPAAWEDVWLLGSRGGLDREGLRKEVAAGRAVTVVGSSWQALELACWLQEGRSVSSVKVRYDTVGDIACCFWGVLCWVEAERVFRMEALVLLWVRCTRVWQHRGVGSEH